MILKFLNAKVSFDLMQLVVCLTFISQCFNLSNFMCIAVVVGSGFNGSTTPIRFLSSGKEGISFKQKFVRDFC